MNIETYQVTIPQMKSLILQANPAILDVEMGALVEAARYSQPLLASLYDNKLLSVFGLIPITVLSDTAHIWVHTTDEATKHKTIYGRASVEILRNMLDTYSELQGFCFTKSAKLWLTWLGAEFSQSINNAHPFTFRRAAWRHQ